MGALSAVYKGPHSMPTLFVAWRNLGPVGDLGDVDKLTWQHFKGNPHHLHRLAHSPSPPGTHTCAWIRASLSCQSEPPEETHSYHPNLRLFLNFRCNRLNPLVLMLKEMVFHKHTNQVQAFSYINILRKHAANLSFILDQFDHKCFAFWPVWP